MGAAGGVERRLGFRHLGLGLGVALGLAVALVFARGGLEPVARPVLESLVLRWFGDGDLVQLGSLRFDPIFARGFVVEDVTLSVDPLTLHVPALFVRPNLHALLQGRLEPTLASRRFEVVLDAHDGPSALIAFYHFLEKVVWPGTSLALRGGEVFTTTGTRLLEHVELDLGDTPEQPALSVRARQLGKGRIDAHGLLEVASGRTQFDVYVDEVETGDLRRWLALATEREPTEFAELSIATLATGHWSTRLGNHGATLHQLDLLLEAIEREGASPVPHALASRFSAHAIGSFVSHPGPSSASPAIPVGAGRDSRAFEGWLRVNARLGRLRTFALSRRNTQRLLVSGPVGATLWLTGSPRSPQVLASVSLDQARLGVGSWFRKSAGTPARLSLVRSSGTTRVQLQLAGLRGHAAVGPHREFDGETEWLPIAALHPLFPALDGWARGGAIRLALASSLPGQTGGWTVEFDRVELQGSRMPAGVRGLSGTGRILEGTTFEASDLRAEIGGTPVVLDLHAELAEQRPELRLRFRAQTDRLDLTALEPEVPATSTLQEESSGAELHPELRAAVEKPIGLLRRERVRLANLELQSGIIEAERVHCSDETLRDLHIELAFRELRLDIHRLEFRRAQGLERYRGTIDLNPLIPEVNLAAAAPGPAALPAP
jgi:hypothetical protein